ncbi:MAG: twin-arginine translocation signal domain-containing protein [Halapricum sp.]
MTDDSTFGDGLDRRTYLRTLGAAGAGMVLAGCSGGGDGNGGNDPGSNDGTGGGGEQTTRDSTGGGSFACADLTRGSQTLEPGDRPLQMIWDYPETWGDVEQDMANTGRVTGARIGHRASKQSAYWVYLVAVSQVTDPMDADGADAYVNNPAYESTDPIQYDGQAVPRSTFSYEDDPSRQWFLAIPGQTDGEYYATQVILSIEENEQYGGCAEAATSVATGIMDSFRPNPAI